MSLNALTCAKTVMTYVSFGSEIMTHDFIVSLLHSGKTAVTPVCGNGRQLIPALTEKFPEGFKENAYGILEIPKLEAAAVDPAAIDVVIVPCVAFSSTGYRLGYGGGYYDRFLPKLRDGAVTIGVVMDELLYEDIPVDTHDVKTEIVVTQSRCCFTGGNKWE